LTHCTRNSEDTHNYPHFSTTDEQVD